MVSARARVWQLLCEVSGFLLASRLKLIEQGKYICRLETMALFLHRSSPMSHCFRIGVLETSPSPGYWTAGSRGYYFFVCMLTWKPHPPVFLKYSLLQEDSRDLVICKEKKGILHCSRGWPVQDMASASGKGLLTVPKHNRASHCREARAHDRRDQGSWGNWAKPGSWQLTRF